MKKTATAFLAGALLFSGTSSFAHAAKGTGPTIPTAPTTNPIALGDSYFEHGDSVVKETKYLVNGVEVSLVGDYEEGFKNEMVEVLSDSNTSPINMPSVDGPDRVEQGGGGVTTITEPKKNKFAVNLGVPFITGALTAAGTHVAMQKASKLKSGAQTAISAAAGGAAGVVAANSITDHTSTVLTRQWSYSYDEYVYQTYTYIYTTEHRRPQDLVTIKISSPMRYYSNTLMNLRGV